MKKLFALLFIAAAVFTACDDKEEVEPPVPVEPGFYGKLVVDQNDGTFFTKADVRVTIGMAKDGSASMIMHDVQFAQAMPITLTMTVNGIEVETGENNEADTAPGDTGQENIRHISGDGIVPLAMGQEFVQYTITGMTGEWSDAKLQLSLMCGRFPLEYSGEWVE